MPTLIKDVVRGNPVQFEATFYDANSNPVTPNTAVICVAWYANGVANSTNVAMTASGNTWFGTWSSSNVDAVPVDWTIVALDANSNPLAVQDGSFRVVANRSTP